MILGPIIHQEKVINPMMEHSKTKSNSNQNGMTISKTIMNIANHHRRHQKQKQLLQPRITVAAINSSNQPNNGLLETSRKSILELQLFMPRNTPTANQLNLIRLILTYYRLFQQAIAKRRLPIFWVTYLVALLSLRLCLNQQQAKNLPISHSLSGRQCLEANQLPVSII